MCIRDSFVAVLVDETTDVLNKAQFSIALRYVYNGQVNERFLGFTDVSLSLIHI